MKKIKFLLFGFAALFVFALSMVKANAAVDYGKAAGFDYIVETTATENDTATYDILPNDQVVLNVGDTIMGKIVWEKKNSAKFTTTNASLKVGDQWIIPVPAGSAGTVVIAASSTSGGRSYALLDGSEAQIKTVECAKPTQITFTSSDIVTVDGSTYLRFGVVGGELKPTGIQIVLTTGSFEATAQRYQVSYLVPGEDVAFDTEDVEGGETALGKPAKWGYDLKGLYTDADLTTPWDKVVTGACNVYCDLEAWDDSVLGDGDKLTPEILAKAAGLLPIDGNTRVPGTIFTILNRVAYADSALPVNGVESTKALNTGGAFSAKDNARGIAFDAYLPGKIVLYLHGNGTARSVALYNSPTEEGSEAISTVDVEATKTEVIKVEFNVSEPGQYAIGGDGTTYIYSAEFVPALTFHMGTGVNADGTELVRFIMKADNVWTEEQLNSIKASGTMDLVIKGAGLPENGYSVMSAAVIGNSIYCDGQVYSVGGVSFGQEEGTLYAVWVIAVANYAETGLANEYAGATLTAELQALESSSNPTVVHSWTFTVQGA